MKKLLLLLLFPTCVWAAENTVVGDPSGNDNAGYNGKNSLRINSSGQTTTTLGAGEDQTNSVYKVEHQYSYCIDDIDKICKAAAGFVHSVTCYGTDAAATAGRVRLVDDATVTGTADNEVWGAEIAVALYPPTSSPPLDIVMTRGIHLDFTTTADVKCVVSYR